jgi:hypothetical protein
MAPVGVFSIQIVCGLSRTSIRNLYLRCGHAENLVRFYL